MKKLLFFVIITASVLACNKDKFKTEPQVEIKSFGPKEVNKGEVFTLRAIVRDKEGDINNNMTVVRKVQEGTLITIDTLPDFSLDFAFPREESVEIQIDFLYGEQKPKYYYIPYENVDRKISFGLIITDKADHKSAYVETEQILLKKL